MRAVKLILGMEWDSKVDICNLGVMVCAYYLLYGVLLTLQAWQLFGDDHLFDCQVHGT